MTEDASRRRAWTVRAGIAVSVPIAAGLIAAGACIKAGYPLAPTGQVEIRKDTAGALFAADLIDANGMAIPPRQSPYQTGVTLLLTEASEPAFAAFVDVRIEPPEALSLHSAQKEGTPKPTCAPEEGTFRCTAGKDGYAKFLVSSDGDWSGEARIVVSWAGQREERTVEILPAGLPDEATNFTLVAGSLDAASHILPTFLPLQCMIGPVPDDLGSKWREGQIRAREAYVRATPPAGAPGVIENAPVIIESLHSEAALSTTQDCAAASRVTRLRVLLGPTGESSPFYLCFSDIGGDIEFAVTSGQKVIEPNRQVTADAEPRLLRVQTLQSVVYVGDAVGLFEVSAYNAERTRIQMPVDIRVDDDQLLTLERASVTLEDESNPATILDVTAKAVGTATLHVTPRLFASPDCTSDPVTIAGTPCKPQGDACASSLECCSGYACIAGICSVCKPQGQPCSSSAQCCAGFNCLAGVCNTCTPQGQPCSSCAQCCAGFNCLAGVCNVCKPQGQPCSSSAQCCAGLTCNNSTCSMCKPQGQPCVTTAECCSGLTCTGGVCNMTSIQMESEPNGTQSAADSIVAGNVCGTISPVDDEDWYSINVSAGVSLSATVSGYGADSCGPSPGVIDSELEIRSSTAQLAINDDINMSTNYCSSASACISTAGIYYIRVRASTLAQIDTFSYCVTIVWTGP